MADTTPNCQGGRGQEIGDPLALLGSLHGARIGRDVYSTAATTLPSGSAKLRILPTPGSSKTGPDTVPPLSRIACLVSSIEATLIEHRYP